MKKCCLFQALCRIRNLLLVNLIFLPNLFAMDYSFQQDLQMVVDVKSGTVEAIFNQISKQSKLEFFYNTNVLDVKKQINLTKPSGTIEEVLKEVLKNDYTFTIKDNYILITERKSNYVLQTDAITISGIVKDEDNQHLPGVTVRIKGTSVGVATDAKGEFKIQIPKVENVILQLSFIGYKNKEVVYKGEELLIIILEEEMVNIDEVVVTGIFEKAKDSYTGAVTVITSEELFEFRGQNLITTISNIAPAFHMMTDNFAGSDPNNVPDIQIRGASSLPADLDDLKEQNRNSQNTPLVVLDGFEVKLSKLLDMNESEIESITILKDASATALYGSRASNGVIVITTKLPEPGKLRFSYRGDFSIEIPDLTEYRLTNAREKLDVEYERGLYRNTAYTSHDLLQKLYNERLYEVERGVDTYWLSKPLRTSFIQSHYGKIEGGSQEFRYSAGLKYGSNNGIMKESGRETIAGDIVLSYNYANISFRNSLNITFNHSDDSPYGSFSTYTYMNPYFTTHDENGKLKKTMPTELLFSSAQSNPLWNAKIGTKKFGEYTEVMNNFYIEWSPIPDFKLRGRIGYSKKLEENHDFKPADHTDFVNYSNDNFIRRGSYKFLYTNTDQYEISITSTYNKLFKEKHQLDVGFDYNISQTSVDDLSVEVEGFPNADLDFLGAAMAYKKDGKPSGGPTKERQVSFTGTANYYFDRKYFVEASMRIDGNSKFGNNKRFAPFWSTGIGWNVHNESFILDFDPISRFRLRLTYGITGSNKFDVNQAKTTYRYDLKDKYGLFSGANTVALGNEDLKWQKTSEYNLGLEMGLFNNRLMLNLDFYKKETNNLLANKDLPLYTGFTSYKENAGKVENKGYELTASVFLIRETQKKLFWSVSGALVKNKNKIIKLSEAFKEQTDDVLSKIKTEPARVLVEGQDQNILYMVRSLGIDPATGKEVFLDRFGNSTYKWDYKDAVACGSTQPAFRGNGSTVLRYKNLSIIASFGYRWGGYRYNTTLRDKVENADLTKNVDKRVFDARWRQPGDNTFFKSLNEKDDTYATTRFLKKENVFEMQNLNIQYNLNNNEWVKRNLYAQNLRFSFSTNNLFYFSNIKQERGINYPFARHFSFSFSAIF